MRVLRKNHVIWIGIVVLCGLVLYGGLLCRRRLMSPAAPFVVVALDCRFVNDPNSEYFPITICCPPARDTGWGWHTNRDPLAAKFGRVGTLATYKTITGKAYFGIRLFKGGPESSQEPEAIILEFYRHPSEGDGSALDMYLNTKVTCELRIDNFQGGTVRHFETKERVTPPYVFTAQNYHLEALIGQSGESPQPATHGKP